MKTVSLADISYEQGLQLLALRKQAMDAGQVRRMTPEALANTFPLRSIGQATIEKLAEGGFLDSLKSGIKNVGDKYQGIDPSVRKALLSTVAGTGLGAAAGVGSAYRRGDKNYGRNALRGGIAGAAVGGGLGLALNPQLANKIQEKTKPVVDNLDAKTQPGDPAAANLQSKATSINPELAGLATGLGSGGAAIEGIRRVHNYKSYDPQAMANHLWEKAQTGAVGATDAKGKMKPSKFSMEGLSRMLGYSQAETVGRGGKLGKAELLRELIQKGHVNSERLATLLEKADHGANVFGKMKSGPTFFNSKTPDTKSMLSSVVGKEGLQEAMEAAERTGFRSAKGSLRPKKVGIAGLLATLGLGGVGYGIKNYRADAAVRNQALEAVKNQITDKP
jgi:hypothetical protein